MLKCESILVYSIYSLFQRLKMKKSPVSVNATCFPSRAMTIRAEIIMLYSILHTKLFCLKTPDEYHILTRQSFEKFDKIFGKFKVSATKHVLR